ncbi:MAG: F0F1 ATP synthase subunit alpha [Nitrospiria bacterium]
MLFHNTQENPKETRTTDWLRDYQFGPRITEQGSIVSIGDGIAWLKGLPSASMDEMIYFEEGSLGLVFQLSKQHVGVILLRQLETLTSGSIAYLSGQRLSMPVGGSLIGRAIDPLGKPLDGGTDLDSTQRQEMDILSPALISRDFVQEPLYTGSKIIDTLIPVGKGQRQLIIGDHGTGKSSFAIDCIINQSGKEVRCIYVLIGQKRSSVVETIETLRRRGAMAHTTVIVGEATALPGLKYLAPFAGCAVAEFWMRQGKDTLIVYDDLTMHARTYRELSLLLRRSPGREAYPGDIFFLHSRLLERSARLAAQYGGGSMTAFPIVETEQGEIAAYIPTNLISITDGQVYFDSTLFEGGFLPPIDIKRSVSRIGGKAQHPRIKEEAGRMKLDYMQFLELEVFTRFGSHLEASMEAKIKRGRILREILKQDRLSPLSVEFNMGWLIAFNERLFDDIKVDEVSILLDQLASVINLEALKITTSREVWVQTLKSRIKSKGRNEQTS